jgi:hypothetical protein
MLGVQNNNRDEIHYRVSIKNCSKMTMKTIFFPSMKHIIFEAIYSILLCKKMPFVFNYDVIQHLVESLNLYGMSIEKFRRLLKTILTEHFFKTDLYFLFKIEL